jgi:2-polyprenyl-3-methyl-5-hydroxy-6-metoxy-1,4-benzoquinol methylase
MKPENIAELARYWNDVAREFDAIYTGDKGPLRRALDRWLRKDMYQRFAWVLERSAGIQGRTACDIGCGSGRFATALAKQGAIRVVGVDIAPQMLELARGLATQQGVEQACEFVHGDVLDWQTSEQFDLVIAIGLWDYIADPLPRLRVIRRLSRGRFLSSWPRLWTWRTPIRQVRLGLKGCPVYFFRRPQIDRYLQESGFRVRSCQVIGKLYCVEAEPV